MIGAFHGAMPRITPTGSRNVIATHPGLSDGIVSPLICVVSAAASRIIEAARPRLNNTQPLVAPISPIIASTKASAFDSRATAAFIRMARRAFGPMAAHAGKADAARSAIAAISSAFMALAVDATTPVIGLIRSNNILTPVIINITAFNIGGQVERKTQHAYLDISSIASRRARLTSVRPCAFARSTANVVGAEIVTSNGQPAMIVFSTSS